MAPAADFVAQLARMTAAVHDDNIRRINALMINARMATGRDLKLIPLKRGKLGGPEWERHSEPKKAVYYGLAEGKRYVIKPCTLGRFVPQLTAFIEDQAAGRYLAYWRG